MYDPGTISLITSQHENNYEVTQLKFKEKEEDMTRKADSE